MKKYIDIHWSHKFFTQAGLIIYDIHVSSCAKLAEISLNLT